MNLLEILFLMFLLFMSIQGIVNLYFNLYVWEDPERLEDSAAPKTFLDPKVGFTILLPARHEENVIGDTISSISSSNYPSELLEIFVICESSDLGTINAAKTAITKDRILNASIITFADKPVNKPHGLNIGLNAANFESIVIFDAEDEVHQDIFNVANTIYITKKADIIQAGVQLMNYSSKWFSAHNVLEYFFWFKSRMHFHTSFGMTPLGGNTVFFKTDQLRQYGGWEENCLTEDAEIGIRMSVNGAKVVSTYDAIYVTKEETPDSVSSFVKQRTRWNQGFIQTLRYGHWRRYDTLGKKLLCLYTLSFPIIQGILFLLTPFIIFLGLKSNFPVIISLFSFSPLLISAVQLIVYLVGLHEFSRDQNIKLKRFSYLKLVITFIPYQILLGLGATRAVYRDLKGINNWEKTEHNGVHRIPDKNDKPIQLASLSENRLTLTK